MKSSNISVVILFYRTPEKVITRLNNYKDFDLYILDQSNDLKLKEKVKKIFPKIKYYGVSRENKGFAKGINFLVKKVKKWRREWDSNPRKSFPLTRFPSVRLKPLGHLSKLLRYFSQ